MKKELIILANMEKKITIPNNTNYVEFIDIIKQLMSEFGVDYHETHNDNGTDIEYNLTNEMVIFNKWVNTGFMAGLDPKYQRKMAETFEHLAKITSNTKLLQAFDLCINPTIGTWAFPITRKVYLNLLETGDEDKFDHLKLLRIANRVYEDNITELELWYNGSGKDGDYEADLCNTVVTEVLSEFRS